MHHTKTETRATFWQTFLTFSATRIVIAAVLLIYLIFSLKKEEIDSHSQLLYWGAAAAYLILALSFMLIVLRYRQRFLLQLITPVTIDILMISALYSAAGGAKTGLAILYLFPLAGSAILSPLLLAFFFVSVVTLFLLAETAYQTLTLAAEPAFLQIGLYGAAFFTSVFLINRLASKLIKQEELAIQRGKDLQVQEEINRLVIADMGDGILVTGPNSEILTANPAAGRMLGLPIPMRLTDIASLMPIANAFFAWRERSRAGFGAASEPESVTVDNAHLMLRFVTVQTPNLILMEERTVIFMQDVTEIENRAQQLKLASMGRLTASIAHEVRNPLSAIFYASSLLGEEAPNAVQARLLRIIGDNVDRLNRMIEDILKLSRKAQPHNEALALIPFLTEILGEFQETHMLPPGLILLDGTNGTDGYRAYFDPLHLREVVMNLLTNAVRYASGADGSIRIFVMPNAAGRLELHVQDDGPPITPEVRAHLFEPFYTTSSKGTGLGLYLARELCLNNGATIDYEYRADKGRFVVTFTGQDTSNDCTAYPGSGRRGRPA